MDLRQQALAFMVGIQTRKKNPVASNTVRTYSSLLESVILPRLGSKPLKAIENGALREFVASISGTLAPTTVAQAQALVKAVVASAVDTNGNQLYPRTWNPDFIDAPSIRKTDLKAPVVGREALQQALGRAQGLEQALYGLLAGTGLRIGEALALGTRADSGSYWDAGDRVIYVSSTWVHATQEVQDHPKTEAGVREIDVHPDLNEFLARLPLTESGLIFGSTGVYSTMLRRMRRLGISEGFHSFRRFRVTHLETESVPRPLIKFWVGHADSDITDRYVKIGRDLAFRRSECERAGLGFTLPEAP